MASNETVDDDDENQSGLFLRILMVIILACICILGVIGNVFTKT